MSLRARIKAVLKATRLDRLVSRAKYVGRLAVNPQFRRLERQSWSAWRTWRRQHAAALRPPLYPPGAEARALIVAKGTLVGAQIEIALIKALELAGFVPVVLGDRSLDKHFRLAGVTRFLRWEDFTGDLPMAEAAAIVAPAGRVDDLIDLERNGARVGKFALSTTFRTLRTGRLDFAESRTRGALTRHVAEGLARAAAAPRVLEAAGAEVALFMGNRYTGQGELLDAALARGMDVLTWFDAHRSSSLMLKRYNRRNRDVHHGSIGDGLWAELRAMPWTMERRRALRAELHDNYAAGDWYSRGGTQVNKAIVEPDRLRARLQLDPARKTAVIFPHIVWDATLFWGVDLFANYEDWLVATVRAAGANPRLNWVIKIHPAHVAKSAMERYAGDAAEMAAIRARVGALPPHVVVVPPDSDINTYSLFSVMDYCLTVRGTIGIEAASFGIRVLTAGSGRYDRRGFTVDSNSAAEYLARLATLHTLTPMPPAERELAERFAYGAFVVRPLLLSSFSIDHAKDIEATTSVRCHLGSSGELRQAPDLRALAAWAGDRTREDFQNDQVLGAAGTAAAEDRRRLSQVPA